MIPLELERWCQLSLTARKMMIAQLEEIVADSRAEPELANRIHTILALMRAHLHDRIPDGADTPLELPGPC